MKTDYQELEKIHQLIKSTDQKNVAIGLEILKSLPPDQKRLTYEFVIGFFHPEATVRRKAKALFKKGAPKDFYDQFSKEINFSKIYGKIYEGYPHGSKTLTPILDQVIAKDVLDAEVLGKYMLDLWAGSWEFCCKHGIGDDVKTLKRVQDSGTLYLSYTWPELPEGLWKMKRISDLIIVNRQLSTIPNEINQLSNLKSLELHVEMEEFPVSILGLLQLQKLEVGNKEVSFYETIPKEITNLKNLKELVLESLPKELPAVVCQITELETLKLWSFKEALLPNEITQLKKLKVIDLEYILRTG